MGFSFFSRICLDVETLLYIYINPFKKNIYIYKEKIFFFEIKKKILLYIYIFKKSGFMGLSHILTL